MTYDDAIKCLHNGAKVAIDAWSKNGSELLIYIKEDEKVMKHFRGVLKEYEPTEYEMRSNGWMIVG